MEQSIVAVGAVLAMLISIGSLVVVIAKNQREGGYARAGAISAALDRSNAQDQRLTKLETQFESIYSELCKIDNHIVDARSGTLEMTKQLINVSDRIVRTLDEIVKMTAATNTKISDSMQSIAESQVSIIKSLKEESGAGDG